MKVQISVSIKSTVSPERHKNWAPEKWPFSPRKDTVVSFNLKKEIFYLPNVKLTAFKLTQPNRQRFESKYFALLGSISNSINLKMQFQQQRFVNIIKLTQCIE